MLFVEAHKQSRARVYMALLSVQLFFSLNYFATKIVLAEVPASAWAAIRVSSAALLMALIVIPRGKGLPRRLSDILPLALYSLFGVVINQICFAEGLARTTAAHSAIINSSIPVSTLLFAVLLRRESLSLRKIYSIALSLCGVLYILKIDQFCFSDTQAVGDLLTFINSCSFALFLVLSKGYVGRNDPLVSTTLLMLIGSIGVNLYGYSALTHFDTATISWRAWTAAGFVVVFATVLTYFFNYWALKRVESSQVAFFIYIQPLVAAIISVAYLGERITLRMVVAAVLIFTGFFISTRQRTSSINYSRR